VNRKVKSRVGKQDEEEMRRMEEEEKKEMRM
jgi:hypothetical protein